MPAAANAETIFNKRSNADRAAARMEARTGQPWQVAAAMGGGYRLRQVSPAGVEVQAPVFKLAVGKAGKPAQASVAAAAPAAVPAPAPAGRRAPLSMPARPAPVAAPAKVAAPGRPRASHQAALDAAAKGQLPEPPDFSADTHRPYRAKLARLVELAAAGDVPGLEAMEIKPTSTSPKALIRFRDTAVLALRARN